MYLQFCMSRRYATLSEGFFIQGSQPRIIFKRFVIYANAYVDVFYRKQSCTYLRSPCVGERSGG